MKYTNEITINMPREKVIKMLDDAENMKYWQKGLLSYKFLGGEPGKVGSQMEMSYMMGKRKFDLVETIVINDFPKQFSAIYETKGVWNQVDNFFTENADGSTKWVADCEFKFSGMMKIMSWFMPSSMFKKQSCQYLDDFKSFVEKGIKQNET